MSKKKKNNIYISASRYFQNGEIEKAIKKCEEGMSQNLKNVPIINLKGLLLYLKGDLQGAVTTWKINSDYNDDITAKNYIHDSKKDNERLVLYRRGEELIKNVHIDEAITIFNKCKESDFNSIKVNLALAICYLKKGEYSLASLHTTKVLEIDKHNKEALEIAKQLKNYAGIKLEINKSDISLKIVTCIILILIMGVGITAVTLIDNKDQNKNVNNKVLVDKQNNEIKESAMNEEKEKGENNTKDVLVNVDKINEAISNKEYSTVEELIQNINNVELTEKEEAVYYNAKELLSSEEAIKYFYEKGLGYYNNKNYEEANKEFLKLYNYGKDSYLFQHGLFFIGVCNEKINKKSEAMSYYEEYYNKYPEGSYIEVVIYSLVMLYKEEDLSKCRLYANHLKNNYPNSIYNNQSISKLLE